MTMKSIIIRDMNNIEIKEPWSIMIFMFLAFGIMFFIVGWAFFIGKILNWWP